MGYTEMISGSHLLSVPHETAGYQGERLSSNSDQVADLETDWFRCVAS